MSSGRLTFLGTGTSTGVPQIGCNCDTCTSTDPRDKRLRASALVETDGVNLLIDAGPDLRTQLLAAGSPRLDALLITHSHYDHIGGIIDMRSYCFPDSFPVYCQANVADDLHTYFPYCFGDNLYPGVPTFDIHIIKPFVPFKVKHLEVVPLPVMHYKLEIVGYRIGNLAYITDCKTMPEATVEALRGIDTLVINALRLKPHMSHLSLHEAIDIIERIGPRRTYLTHMSHDMGTTAHVQLPPHISLAHDMLVVDLSEEQDD